MIAAEKRRLVIFSPFPPAKSGISDYVAELIPFHMAEFDVTLVVADDAPPPSDDAEPRVLLASEFRRHRKFFEGVPRLYHVGNNPQHCYMLDFLGTDPGIVVLHDHNLVYLHEMATLRWGDQASYIEAMEREYGGAGRDLVSWQMRNGYRELFAGYELPLNGYVLENATGIIAHSRQVQYRVAGRVPDKPVWYVRHHLSPTTATYFGMTKQSARAQLGLPSDEVIVTAIGFVTRAKQIALVLDALTSLQGSVPRFRFVLAGERKPHEYDVDADIERSAIRNRVICTDYVDEDLFFKHLAAADVVVNLRYPSGGEMSGTLVRSLGMGLPTIVTDSGPMAEFPDHVVRKIPWTGDRQRLLTAALRELMTNAAARKQLGAQAAEFVRREHDIRKISEQYARIINWLRPSQAGDSQPLKQYFPHPTSIARNLRHFANDTSKVYSAGRLWWTLPAAPLGAEQQRALVVSDNPASTSELLHIVFGWDRSAISSAAVSEFVADVPAGAWREEWRGQFSFLIISTSCDLAEYEAARLLLRANIALRRGGTFCLEYVTGSGSKRSTLDASALPRRLRDSGFSSVREWSAGDGVIADLVLDLPEPPDVGSVSCLSARKVSDYFVWTYQDPIDSLPRRWGGRTTKAGSPA